MSVGDGEQADVVDDDEVGAHDLLDGSADGVVGAVAADQGAEGLEGEPGDVVAGVDGGVAERFEEVGLAGPGRAAHDEVLVAVDPLEGA